MDHVADARDTAQGALSYLAVKPSRLPIDDLQKKSPADKAGLKFWPQDSHMTAVCHGQHSRQENVTARVPFPLVAVYLREQDIEVC